MLSKLFLDHPADLGETYAEHAREASSYGFTMIAAGVACLVHAAVPALFKSTGSQTIRTLNDRLVRKRGAKRDATIETRHGGWVI
jgi:hypothetical protein